MKALISPEAAMRLIRANFPAIPTVHCPLDKCAGRFVREAVVADRPFPPFNRSMMDGYALRAAEIGDTGVFHISIQAPAGSAAQQIGSDTGHCAEIMTGAVVPEDADCVVPYEATKRMDAHRMQLLDPSAHTKGDCIHKYASDRPSGEVLLSPGAHIGSREIAVAATCGYSTLAVAKVPSIAIVSTGDELVGITEQPLTHQIRRSNDIMVETALARAYLHAQQRSHLPDDTAQCTEQLKALIAQNQIVLISGGISMGKKDFIPQVLDDLGLTGHFHGITQKPGKPMGYWSNAECAVFTLPGNPLSTLTCLHHYVLPAIHDAMGQTAAPPSRRVRINAPIRARDDLTLFLPVKLEADNQASPQPAQNSGDLVRILNSDGYIVVPPTAAKAYAQDHAFDFHPWH